MRSMRKGTPGKGECARPDSFSYTPVQFGLKNYWTGWVAGACYWADEAHEHKPPMHYGSQPCLHWATNGEVRCVRCRKQPATIPLGWLPVWREQDHNPCIVIVHRNVADLVNDLKFLDFVIIGRVDKTSSVFVRRAESKQLMRTDNEYRKRPADITMDLLTMWKLPELTEWLKYSPVARVGTDPSEASEDEKKRAAEQFTPMTRAAALRFGAVKPEGAAGMDDAMQRIEQRAKSAEKNGKHTTEGGGK